MKEVKRSLSRREAALLLALLLLTLSLAGWRFLFAPLQQRAADLRREQAALILEQERMLTQLKRGEDLFAAWEAWQSHAETLQTFIPSPDRLPEVLTLLEALLHAFPVTLHSLQIGEIETGEVYAVLPIKLRSSGEAASLLELLECLEQFEHLLIIDQIAWSRGQEENASLDLSFRLVFHPP